MRARALLVIAIGASLAACGVSGVASSSGSIGSRLGSMVAS